MDSLLLWYLLTGCYLYKWRLDFSISILYAAILLYSKACDSFSVDILEFSNYIIISPANNNFLHLEFPTFKHLISVPGSFKEMKSLTGLACPNKWCSRKSGSPELAASGILFAELTQPKGNKSCLVHSEQGKVWSVMLTEARRQPVRTGSMQVSQNAWLFLGSLKRQRCCSSSAWL